MLVTSYNRAAFGDTLIAITGQDQASQTTEEKGGIVGIYGKNGQAIGFNFFNVSKLLPGFTANGQVFLDQAQLQTLNAAIEKAGLTGSLPLEASPTFVIAKITEFKPHPNSDHLNIAQVDIGSETKQIVCGAPNAKLGQTVVAALPGAMMPDGKVIWPGELRGVDSYGMLCSARELGIKGAPQKRGILIMPDTLAAGTTFDFKKAEAVVAAQAQ